MLREYLHSIRVAIQSEEAGGFDYYTLSLCKYDKALNEIERVDFDGFKTPKKWRFCDYEYRDKCVMRLLIKYNFDIILNFFTKQQLIEIMRILIVDTEGL